jgi:hypothetical protein
MWSSTTPNLCVSSSIWTTHRATNGLTSRFHLKVSTPSYLFQHALQQTSEAYYALILSCFGPRASTWLTARLIFPTFQLSSPVFCTTLHMRLGLPHPSITNIYQCVCTHPIDPMGIHLLCCAHGNERIRTHNAICDTFVAITQNVSFHVGRK